MSCTVGTITWKTNGDKTSGRTFWQNIRHRVFALDRVSYDITYSEPKTPCLFRCNHFRLELNAIQTNQSEIKIPIRISISDWGFCYRLNFSIRIGYRTVVFTLKQRTSFLYHCKHYYAEVNVTQRVSSETKSSDSYSSIRLIFFLRRLNFLFRIDYSVVLLAMNQRSYCLFYCKQRHREFNSIQ